ncbi:MAG: hypothetical protein LUF78_10335 [Clostridiales bacterium]|nr:hypothetical protein [Clostridiales bacterium]
MDTEIINITVTKETAAALRELSNTCGQSLGEMLEEILLPNAAKASSNSASEYICYEIIDMLSQLPEADRFQTYEDLLVYLLAVYPNSNIVELLTRALEKRKSFLDEIEKMPDDMREKLGVPRPMSE